VAQGTPRTPAAAGAAKKAVVRMAAAWILLPVFVLRIRNEEEVLLRDLSGYEEYRQRVRYRLLPFVW
jgi:protein-S-isoprenylcysteine O-methyltransferase Ste14